MRIVHTGDWHLGKIVNEKSMLEDQEYYFKHWLEAIEEAGVEAVVMTGDLYDRSLPPKEAVSLAHQIFSYIINDLQIPLLVIAGNHDSDIRIEYANDLLEKSGLYIEGIYKEEIRSVKIQDLRFWLLPFADYARVKQVLDEPDINTIQEATIKSLENIEKRLDPKEKNILLYHGYVVNGGMESLDESESERPLSIGTVDYIDVSYFDSFDYVALGHLHKAQKVKRETVRYSGSPLKYSKSEVNHQKKSWLVDFKDDGIEIEELLVEPLRDMRILKGDFADLMTGTSEDYVFIELEDKTYQLDAMNRLKKHYPNALSLEYPNLEMKREGRDQVALDQVDQLTPLDMFKAFYKQYGQEDLDEDQERVVLELFDQAQKKEEEGWDPKN